MEIDENINLKFQMFEQQIIAIQQQLEAIEQAMLGMSDLSLGLDEIKKDNEILAQIGRGIFVKSKILSEELIVDIGNKNYVKKTIPKTKQLISEQIKKLENIKEDLNKELEKINQELTDTLIKNELKHSSKECKDPDCKHKH